MEFLKTMNSNRRTKRASRIKGSASQEPSWASLLKKFEEMKGCLCQFSDEKTRPITAGAMQVPACFIAADMSIMKVICAVRII
jgi:hypothetical protein